MGIMVMGIMVMGINVAFSTTIHTPKGYFAT